MWEVDFGALEQARAIQHGRRPRREDRHASDAVATISLLNADDGEDGEDITGWTLDRSTGGARILLPSSPAIEAGTIVLLAIGELAQPRLARVVWSRQEEDAGLLGLELVVVSGEVTTVDAPPSFHEIAKVA